MRRALPVIFVILALAAIAYAQLPGDGPAGPPRMGPPLAPVMIAQGSNLYILRGDNLMVVDAGTLQVLRQTMLPRPEPPKPIPPK